MGILEQVFPLVCGQDPGHTWAPGGVPLPLCQRCTGLYAGAAVAALLPLALGIRPGSRFPKVHGLFILLMVPFGFHLVPQGPLLRTISGMLFGLGVASFLLAPLEARRPPDGGRRKALTHVLVAGLSIPAVAVLALRGGPPGAAALSGAAFAGLLALWGLAAANVASASIALSRRLLRSPWPWFGRAA